MNLLMSSLIIVLASWNDGDLVLAGGRGSYNYGAYGGHSVGSRVENMNFYHLFSVQLAQCCCLECKWKPEW